MPKTTIAEKIVIAIRFEKEPKGSSRTFIAKYLKAELSTDNASALKKALKKATDSGDLEQTGQRYKVKGESYEVPEGERLGVEDAEVGEGEAAEAGDEVTVSYVGRLADGSVFDRAKSFTFVLGAGDVIKGWDQGVAGMKPGGSRKLTVPSKLGYGMKGCAGEPPIPPGATLSFVVGLQYITPS